MSQIAISNQRAGSGLSVRGLASRGGSRPSLAIVLLLLSMFVPSQASFSVAGLVFSGYRLVIFAFFIPGLIRLLSQRRGTAGWIDAAMLFAGIWIVTATIRNDGLSRGFEGGGAMALEFVGTYVLARAYVTKEAHVVWIAKFIAIIVLAIMPFMVVESITGKHVLKDIVSAITGVNIYIPPDTRFGLERAWGVFDHPILAGVITSTAISLIWFSMDPRKPLWVRLAWIFGPVLATVSTFSSGALGSLVIQLGCIIWYYSTQNLKHRWLWLAAGLASCYFAIEILSNRTAYAVFISFLTFNPGTGFYRVEILHWGFYHNILREPLFGIGETDWIRAAWMHSTSVDNFWLKITMDRGLPMFILVFSSTMIAFFGNRRRPFVTTPVRLGWTLSMIAICFAGFTVHFWNHSFLWFAFFLGLGAVWLRPSPPVKRRTDDGSRRGSGVARPFREAGAARIEHSRREGPAGRSGGWKQG